MTVSIPTQFEPPADFTPMLVGALADRAFGFTDIYGGIIYLAQQGYITVKPKFSGDESIGPDCKVSIIGEPDTQSLPEELRYLLDELSNLTDDMGLMSLRSYRLPTKWVILKNKVSRHLEENGYAKPSRVPRLAYLVPTLVVVVTLILFGFNFSNIGWIIAAGFFTAVALFLSWLSRYALTKKGKEVRNHIRGYKLFLKKTEIERYKHFSHPRNDVIEWHGDISYAVSMGIVKEWRQFFDEVFEVARHGIVVEEGNRRERYYKYY